MLPHKYSLNIFNSSLNIYTSRTVSKEVMSRILAIYDLYTNQINPVFKQGAAYRFLNSQVGLRVAYEPEFALFLNKIIKLELDLLRFGTSSLFSISDKVILEDSFYITKTQEFNFDFKLFLHTYILESVSKYLKEILFLKFALTTNNFLITNFLKLKNLEFSDNTNVVLQSKLNHKYLMKIHFEGEKLIQKGKFGLNLETNILSGFKIFGSSDLFILSYLDIVSRQKSDKANGTHFFLQGSELQNMVFFEYKFDTNY